jgi:hypothetical protein
VGKASRLKDERAAERRLVPERQSPEDELSAAVVIVGEVFGIEADCASAAGLLVEIGAQLGHVLRPRPVSVIIREKTTNALLTMGPKASEKLSAEQLSQMENRRPGGRDTGHIVVTSDPYRLMLDPNMRQLGSYGINAPSIVLRVRSTEPESGTWEFTSETLDLLYLVDDGNGALLPRYEDARREGAGYAQAIAAGIRAGVDPIAIAARMKKR